MKGTDGLRPYLEQLRALPFVKRARAVQEVNEAVVTIDALSGSQSFTVAHVRSHLAKSDVELWAGRARKRGPARPLLLVAPYVSGPMGARLRDAGIRYLDAVGNVFLSIEGPKGVQHTALVEGRAPARPPATERAWRAPSYQTLFALLVRPSLLHATVREVAAVAEVSTTPVLQVREKLVELGFAAKRKDGLAWTSGSLPRARELWLRGYESTLRPSLLLQRYRPRQHVDIQTLEAELEARLQERYAWRWGGAAAAFRLDPLYRGEVTVVHVDAPRMSTQELTATLRMVPDPAGPVVILRRPGALAFELGRASTPLPPMVEAPDAITHVVEPRTVHPLLVWAELLQEGNDRASEAAAELAAHLLEGDEDA
jgi:hypothetical protein